MPDEITPEQWREWAANPCTQRLLSCLKRDIEAFEEIHANKQAAALRRVLSYAPRIEEPTPASGPRRVRVNG